MARDLVLDVIERSRGDALGDTARDAEKAAKAVDGLGDSFKTTADRSGHVDTEIARLKAHVVELGEEFDRTGDRDLFKSLRQDRGELSRLQKIRKELDALGDAGEAAGSGGLASIGEMLGALPAQAKGAGMAIGVTLAAGAAPLIGAAIAGAVAGGVGLGGIAGGIAAAASNPRVQAAAADFAADMKAEFADVGNAFVSPIEESLSRLSAGISGLGLDDLLRPLADDLPEITDGLIGFAESAMPGLTRAIDAAGPAIDVIVKELPKMGQAFGDMIGDIAESDGAVEGLRYTLELISMTARATGVVIGGLSDTFHWMATTGMDVVGVVADIADVISAVIVPATLLVDTPWDMLGEAADHMSDMASGAGKIGAMIPGSAAALDGMGDAAERTGHKTQTAAANIDQMNASISRSLGLALSMTESTIAWEAGIDRLTQSVEDNGTTLDIGTAAGRANAEALTNLVGVALRQRDANLELGLSQADANTQFQKAVDEIYRIGHAAGLTDADLKKIVGEHHIDIVTTYTSVYNGPSALKGDPLGYAEYFFNGLPGRASGGPVMAGQPYVVGEHRPELFVPSENGTIVPSVPTGAGRSSGGSGGGSMSYRPLVVSGDVIGEAMFLALQKKIWDEYGGDIVVAFTRKR